MLYKKVGVISCSGEECLGGTLSRLATRTVMEKLREGKVVSLCLPLYIAGGDEERDFAKNFPVIAVDGCSKCCARKATLKYSGEVKDSLDISELLGEKTVLLKNVSARDMNDEHYKMADNVAEEVCKKVDKILAG
jgi:uncharacterized metal-binding protein